MKREQSLLGSSFLMGLFGEALMETGKYRKKTGMESKIPEPKNSNVIL